LPVEEQRVRVLLTGRDLQEGGHRRADLEVRGGAVAHCVKAPATALDARAGPRVAHADAHHAPLERRQLVRVDQLQPDRRVQRRGQRDRMRPLRQPLADGAEHTGQGERRDVQHAASSTDAMPALPCQ